MKKIAVICLGCILLLSCVACAAPTPAPQDDVNTRLFTDSLGRDVLVPEEITSVAVSGPAAQIVLFALCPDLLAGTAIEWDPGSERFIAREYYQLPVLGQLYGGKGELNLETLLSSGAQIVVDVGQAKDSTAADLDALQQQTGLPFVHISAATATMDETYRLLGQLFGREEEAEELALYCRDVYEQAVALSAAVEKKSPFQKKIMPEVSAMLEALAPYATFPMKLLFGNLWLFGPVLKIAMPMVSAQAAAMLQTTCAFTMQKGSDACNVLPQEANLWANLRFIPHQGMEESLRLIEARAAEYGLETEVLHAGDFTPPVDIKGEAWQQAEAAVKKTFPGLPVSPYVMTGATDCAFWQEICPNCVRFAPVVYGPEQMRGMHGLNENIPVDCLPGAVDFYKNLIDLSK